MNGDTQIYVSGREYKVTGDLVTYEQIVGDLERTAQGGGTSTSSARPESTTKTT